MVFSYWPIFVGRNTIVVVLCLTRFFFKWVSYYLSVCSTLCTICSHDHDHEMRTSALLLICILGPKPHLYPSFTTNSNVLLVDVELMRPEIPHIVTPIIFTKFNMSSKTYTDGAIGKTDVGTQATVHGWAGHAPRLSLHNNLLEWYGRFLTVVHINIGWRPTVLYSQCCKNTKSSFFWETFWDKVTSTCTAK